VLDDVRHVDARKLAVVERPGVAIEIPDLIGGGIGGRVDPDRIRLDLPLATSYIQGQSVSQNSLTRAATGEISLHAAASTAV